MLSQWNTPTAKQSKAEHLGGPKVNTPSIIHGALTIFRFGGDWGAEGDVIVRPLHVLRPSGAREVGLYPS